MRAPRRLAAAASVLALSAALGGCSLLSAAIPVLTDVVAVAQDAVIVLDLLQDASRSWFALHPNADAQAKIEKAITTAKLANDMALRTARGAKALDAKDAEAAFQDFRVAYAELAALLKQAGIIGADGKIGAGRHAGARVPEPMAIGKVGR